jgi:hypothetical protein
VPLYVFSHDFHQFDMLTWIQPDFSRSEALMGKSVEASMIADDTQRQINLLVQQWSKNYE